MCDRLLAYRFESCDPLSRGVWYLGPGSQCDRLFGDGLTAFKLAGEIAYCQPVFPGAIALQ